MNFSLDSPEVAQFLNLSIPECRAIVERYYEEEERELFRIREKWVMSQQQFSHQTNSHVVSSPCQQVQRSSQAHRPKDGIVKSQIVEMQQAQAAKIPHREERTKIRVRDPK